jgi:hypothetical protein
MEKNFEFSKSKERQVQPIEDSFDYKMGFLKVEVDLIDKSITRLGNMSKSTRHWAILVWAGSIAIALGQSGLRKFSIVSSIVTQIFNTDGIPRAFVTTKMDTIFSVITIQTTRNL